MYKSRKRLKASVSLVISSVLADSTRYEIFKKMNVFNSEFEIFDRLVVMDLRRFITLKTVVEEGSFLRASQKLCCTQSTVTFHIQQLEREFSLQLFEKIGRRMCLTTEGKKLMPHIHELTRVMELIREAARQDAEPGGELRVATGETLLAYKMPQVLQRFKLRAPNVKCRYSR
ncbi:LysR-family transcriptional regulator [Salmonella enterica subsp. enterica]|nr:LysR-family transcriptional regulator [Salmonella enterica subsp. enterica]